MGNDISSIGGAVCTAATSVAAGVCFGQVSALNRSVVHCAQFTANCASNSIVRHGCESIGNAIVCAVASGTCMGQIPALNQAKSACAHNAITAGAKAAKEIISAGDGVLNGIPVVGHVKGAIHYACGDHVGGEYALKASSRTTGVIGGGLAGFACGGPVGAVVGAVSAGAAMDGIVTGADSAIHGEFRPYGNVDAWNRLINDPNPQNRVAGAVGAILLPASDIAAGFGVARAAAARSARLDIANVAEADAVLASEVHPAMRAEQQAAQAAGEAIFAQQQAAGEAALAQHPPPAAVSARAAAPPPSVAPSSGFRSAASVPASSGGVAASAAPSAAPPSDYKSVIEAKRNGRPRGFPSQLRPSSIAPGKIVGYRGVSKLELEALQINGMRYDRVFGDGRNGTQLGRGVYCAEDWASAQGYADLPRTLPDGPGCVVIIRNGPRALRGFASDGLNGLEYEPPPCDFLVTELEPKTRQIFVPEGVLPDLGLKAELPSRWRWW